MKKFFQYLLLITLFTFWGIILTNKEQTRQTVREVKMAAQQKLGIDQPCSRPLEYTIGSIDPKFDVSSTELEQLAIEAAAVWNKAEGKTLLQYNPTADFKINLVYDSRQEQSEAAKELESDLHDLETTDSTLKGQYDSFSAAYKEKVDTYNKDVADYKKDLDKYNADVAHWNEKGGAPSDEYDKLKKEKNDLEDEYEKINQERTAINKLISQTNSIAKKENQIVTSYNNTVATYKSQYGDTQEFEKGVFDGKEIDIYQFKAAADLRLTLVHELGHYLGIGHVENSKSIMYYLIGDQEMNSPTLTTEDRTALNNICKLN
jgi:hypothetical protein